ncbi:DUF2538 family protein [Paenibacillus alvei]|uniref:hypothetical protein n=1 Tax=Paenibacillus alvei TaxID=44250 RepID=UPI00028A372C|nr:hypothetical protein [Paenibacillus alvei]EJW13800.1 hypothetical protein PAV_109p00300 [Paenibacillus alvei DSM 29]MCY9540529.1 DUF2538 family protein [Paenibacillus alvei]MCY9708266.1 DUF2538 family protein [Paenibacillus alvei]MCY9732938.1 DUF2538 family protein [Paenibacillus alvei]MCY9755187.1 DUF2538 family protein [Paenibacillus alvei]
MDLRKQMKTEKEVSGQPTRNGITLGHIWFSTKEHGENFAHLVERFSAHKNPEYAAACYVAAHPEIYYRIKWENSDGPIGWYWGEWIGKDDDDENGYWTESEIVGQLSSSYRGLVRAAVELYTGSHHYFNFTEWLGNAGDEVYKLFVQALEIRRDRFIIDLA